MTFVLNLLQTVANEVRATGNRDDLVLCICRDSLCNNIFTTKFYRNSHCPFTIGNFSPVCDRTCDIPSDCSSNVNSTFITHEYCFN